MVLILSQLLTLMDSLPLLRLVQEAILKLKIRLLGGHMEMDKALKSGMDLKRLPDSVIVRMNSMEKLSFKVISFQP